MLYSTDAAKAGGDLMDLQHLNLKIFTEESSKQIPLDTYIPIFHSWIQKKITEEMLIDVADYAHVPNGPGVMLIGHHASLSMDEAEGRLGFLYNRKVKEEGTNEEKIKRIFRWAVSHAKRLKEESVLNGNLKFKAGSLQLIVNDRLLAPNNEENGKALEADLKKVLQLVYGNAAVKISRHPDPRERLTLDVEIETNLSLENLAIGVL